MDAQPTILDLLFSGADPVELATRVETDQATFSDGLGRHVTPTLSDKAKIIEQIIHHVDMVHERKKPWQLQDDEAYSYWAYGTDKPNRDYGGERPPEIDRAWLKEPLIVNTNTGIAQQSPSLEDRSKEHWAKYAQQEAKAFEHAKLILERSHLMHNDVAHMLFKSGLYKKLKLPALLRVCASACDALGLREQRVRGVKKKR